MREVSVIIIFGERFFAGKLERRLVGAIGCRVSDAVVEACHGLLLFSFLHLSPALLKVILALARRLRQVQGPYLWSMAGQGVHPELGLRSLQPFLPVPVLQIPVQLVIEVVEGVVRVRVGAFVVGSRARILTVILTAKMMLTDGVARLLRVIGQVNWNLHVG